MKINALIIDDEPIALEKLKSYVEKVPFFELAGVCGSGLEAVSFLADHEVDVIFTDINMPDLSGLEFVESLETPPMVVFITAYAQYAVDSYKVSAVDYLLKPYSFADFQRSANKVLNHYTSFAKTGVIQRDDQQSLFLKTDYRYVRVALNTIRYIKGYGEYLQVFIDGNSSPLLTLSSFSAIADRLSSNFLQVHRSYMVNMNKVEQISKNRLIMDADTYIPVGDSYKSVMQSYLQAHSVGASPKK